MITDHPICVTGASGFIASHLVRELMEKGYNVKGTVRDLSHPEKYSFLTSLPKADQHLELVESELLTSGSYDHAVRGCEYVIHTASPYFLDVKDPQQDLVDPAVKGTLNVLKSCEISKQVKKVIITSSVAAITDETGNYDSMVKRADMALFGAKKNGRNCVKVRL